MAAPKRRAAEYVIWKSPHNEPCSLQPIDRDGAVELDILDTQVVLHGRRCLLSIGLGADATEIEYSEYECSVALDRVQITWHAVERTGTTEVERSVHFQQ